MINKVEKTVSYKDRVYKEIKSAIISQRLKAGEQLNERMLAEQMGISRTPVREALSMLENEGWILTEPWKGTFVLDLTLQDVEEVFQMRMVLEPLVVELIIPKLDEKICGAMQDILNEQQKHMQELNADEFIRVDRDFHMFLCDLTGNKRLIQVLGNLSDMLQRLGIKAISQEARYKEVLDEHAKIINALLDNDPVKAKQAMLYHILRTKEYVYKHWEKA